MSHDIQARLRAADPAPNVPAYDDNTAAALLQRAVNSTAAAPTGTRGGARRRQWRRLAVGGAAAATGAVAITVAASLVEAPVASAGIELVREGNFYLVTITDPNRDPEALTAALKSKGLNITLLPEPVSPSLVGSIPWTSMSEGADTITALDPPPCEVPSHPTGGCKVGLRVPVGFSGEARIAVGRTANPGEDYSSAASSISPGERFACQNLRGRPVPDVVAELEATGMTVEYRGTPDDTQDPIVYSGMYVYDVLPRNATTVYVFAQPAAVADPLPEGC